MPQNASGGSICDMLRFRVSVRNDGTDNYDAVHSHRNHAGQIGHASDANANGDPGLEERYHKCNGASYLHLSSLLEEGHRAVECHFRINQRIPTCCTCVTPSTHKRANTPHELHKHYLIFL